VGTPAQVEICRALCAERGWPALEVYQDDDHSAFTGRRRPGYERLFGDVREGRFEVVVAAAVEHLWRSRLEQELFLAMGRQAGLELVATPQGEVLLGETEGLLFRTLVSDLRASIEELCRVERSVDVARLSRMPSSTLPGSSPTRGGAVFEAWDRMTPDERSTVIHAVLGQPGE
jgi:site-specific DNA recombinase